MFEITRAAESDIDAIFGLAGCSGLALWSRDDYARAANAKDRSLLIAREHSENVVGFILVQLLNASMGDGVDVEILNIAVDPRFKRKGIGRRLIAAAFEGAEISSGSKAILEVRASNDSAKNFYRSCGFREQSVRRAYYRDPVEDAILFGANAEEALARLNRVSDRLERIN